jgi:RibD C-terminal domain
LALEILNRELGIERLLLEGAGGSNGAFLQVGLIDEISLAICPAVDGVKGAQRSMTRLTTYLAICGPRSHCRDGIPLLSQCKARKQKMDVLGTQTKENFAILRIIKEIEMPNHGFKLPPRLPRKQWGCGGLWSKPPASRIALPPSTLPSGLVQALEHVGVVFRPMPRYAPADKYLERGRRDRNVLLERFLRFRGLTDLAEGRGDPAVGRRKIGV